MSEIKTYPEMNETIKNLLRRSEEPMNRYILARIEELEKQVSSLALPSNDPLTLDELREMDGGPVYCDLSLCNPVPHVSQWAIVREDESEVLLANGGFLPFSFYGMTWLAYRRKPEEIVRCKEDADAR